jgi:hypothetical protein
MCQWLVLQGGGGGGREWDRGIERWRSDAICLSNRLEARVPERGGGGGGGARCSLEGTWGEEGRGTSVVWCVCESADGRVTAMWVGGGGPGPVGTTGAGGESGRAGGAFPPVRASTTRAFPGCQWRVRRQGGEGDHRDDERTAAGAVGGGPGLEGNAEEGVESGYVGGAFSPAISRTARTTTGWEGPRRGKGAGGREGGTGVWAVGGVAGPARNAGAGGESGPGRGDAQRI